MSGRPRPAATLAIAAELTLEDTRWGDEAALAALVDRTVAATIDVARLDPPPDAELSVLLADDARLRALNRDFRGKDEVTNVLSFPAGPAAATGPLLGDIALAFETVEREAAEAGRPRDAHLTHLVAHGLLHLFSHDHLTDAEAAAMEALETAILARLGLPDPHSDGD